jgi:tRNA(Ile)-lysidine synthase
VKVAAPLVGKVRDALAALGAAEGGIVVAVSGGPDSVALLRALLDGGAGPLLVGHVNHQLRGAESDADEQFVVDLSRTLGCAVRTERVPVALQAQSTGDNLESCARQARYDALLAIARAAGYRWIATGHTADDQAETVLHRLIRGTGLQGLRGIARRRQLGPGICVVRPLLAARRSEVLAYLDALQQPFRLDSSNVELRFTRNRIRQELLPLLAQHYNQAIADILARLAAQADEAWPEIEALAEELRRQAERPRAADVLVFDRAALRAAPASRLREMFRLIWAREGWPQAHMTFVAWGRLAALAQGAESSLDLPGGVRAHCRERVVQLCRHL